MTVIPPERTVCSLKRLVPHWSLFVAEQHKTTPVDKNEVATPSQEARPEQTLAGDGEMALMGTKPPVSSASTVAALTEAGVNFRNEIISGPGEQQILLEDPSGNPMEIFQPG